MIPSKPLLEQADLFGPHLTLDMKGCDPAVLEDQGAIYDLLDQLPGQIGMTKMTAPYVCKWLDKFGTRPGVSGFVMIAESHISIHTFPDQDYVFADIFSCRDFDVDLAVRILSERLGAKTVTRHLVARGRDFVRT